jgi:hypothetical protein
MSELQPPRRVLIEHQNPRILERVAAAATEAGLEVDTCCGPSTFPDRTCPMTTGAGCAKAHAADAIVCGLPLEDIGVFIALRRALPDVDIVLTLSEAERARLSMPGVLERLATVVPRDDTGSHLWSALLPR